jgi:Xaa-Pro aminopeptidase
MKKYAEEIAQLLKDAGVDRHAGRRRLRRDGDVLRAAGGRAQGRRRPADHAGAREIKNWDEIQLLTQAASMVDGVYHMIYEELKPGVRENDIVALSNKMLYEMGSDDVEAINAISGERCNPHPHNFTDRYFRPGDQAFFDILQSYQGYRTCYYRTFNIGRATPRRTTPTSRPRMDRRLDRADQAGRDHRQGRQGLADGGGASAFPNEDAAFGLQFGHGLGLALHERPIISRAVSLDHPMEIKTGMVFALETYCPAPTAIRPRGSRKRSSSPTRAAR